MERSGWVLVDASPLLQVPEACARRAEQDGYLLWRRLLPPGDVLAARAEVLAACRSAGWCDASGTPLAEPEEASTETLVTRLRRLPRWRRLTEHPALQQAMTTALGGRARPAGVAVDVRWPGEPEGSPDAPRDGGWSAWIPLGDCAAVQAGLGVMPGSHRDGVATIVTAWADLGAGDALALDGRTVRQPLAHTGDRLRLAVHCRYRPDVQG